jgi:D-3-phosphoglycerate dehydrogenase
MNIVILDDYQDAVRKLQCAAKLEAYPAKVFTNTVKGIGQLSVRLRDADVIVLIRERTQITRQLVEKLPRLKLISQTGRSARTSTSRPAPSAASWWPKASARRWRRPNSPGR